ncbi:MAG: AfsR/SARP family transcriptional regulator [Blautia sp.]|jgi:DNA-binding SARP family transcriptional activator
MDSFIKLQIFSEFSLENTNGRIDSETARSQQLVKLLLYILIYRDREISHQELIDAMWDGPNTGNPTGALKNLVYRLRNLLKILGGQEYILARRGYYRWNPQILVDSDYETFEELYNEAKLVQEPEAKEKLYEEAFSIYRGSIPEELAFERWLMPVSTWYQSLYLTTARELIALYLEKKEFAKIQQTCISALRVDELDEDFHYWLMRSLMEQYKVDLALKHYNEATKLFRKHLGLRTSEMLKRVYEEMISMKNVHTTLDGQNILDDLMEPDHLEGVYFCEFAVFREIFRVEARRAQRTKRNTVEYILLMTMNSGNFYKETEEGKLHNIRAGMERLEEVLGNYLRVGDVVSRYSDNQYVILLAACKEQDAVRVGRRLMDNFFSRYSEKKVRLSCELITEGNRAIIID